VPPHLKKTSTFQKPTASRAEGENLQDSKQLDELSDKNQINQKIHNSNTKVTKNIRQIQQEQAKFKMKNQTILHKQIGKT